MITDVKRERVAMTREEAITIMQLYKDELEHRIAKIDYDSREIDLYSIHLDAFEVAIEALSAEAEPTVIRCKTLLNAEDFEAVATRIREENRNVIVIPCETEVVSAEAVQGEWIFRTDIPIGGGRESAGYVCSNCRKDYFHVDGMNFCPNCGAKMKGGDNNEID